MELSVNVSIFDYNEEKKQGFRSIF